MNHQQESARELNQRLIPDNAPRASLCGAKAIAAIAVFVSSEEGKAYYRNRYEVRLAQWAEDTTAKHAAQNARADVFRDVQDKVTGWKNPEDLVGYDVLQDVFTLRMFVAKDPFKIAAALVGMTGVDAVLVEEALFDALNTTEETVPASDNEVVSIRDAALELGMTTEELVQQLINDGLIIRIQSETDSCLHAPQPGGLVGLDLGDELVVSPHPDISPVG